jgi:hypothetical protein
LVACVPHYQAGATRAKRRHPLNVITNTLQSDRGSSRTAHRSFGFTMISNLRALKRILLDHGRA